VKLTKDLPVRVAKAGWAHSVYFTPDLASRFQATPLDRPFVIHAGEGVDASARDEVHTLDRMGVLDDRVVLVHGVAFDARGLAVIRRRGAAIIACPVSNLFTLRRTLKKSVFDSGIPVALGTDSALTAPGDLLDALRAARSVWKLSPARLYAMVTTVAARIFGLTDGRGAIREGGVADLIVVRDSGCTPAETLLDLRSVEMVMVGGKIRLVSERFAVLASDSFETISIAERGKFLVDAPVRAMVQVAAARLGAAFRLAGRRVRIK